MDKTKPKLFIHHSSSLPMKCLSTHPTAVLWGHQYSIDLFDPMQFVAVSSAQRRSVPVNVFSAIANICRWPISMHNFPAQQMEVTMRFWMRKQFQIDSMYLWRPMSLLRRWFGSCLTLWPWLPDLLRKHLSHIRRRLGFLHVKGCTTPVGIRVTTVVSLRCTLITCSIGRGNRTNFDSV